MREYFVVALSIGLIVPSILSARSDDSPTLDVRPVCRGIASQSGDTLSAGLMKDSFEECLKSEQDVRDQLKEKWSTFSAADKTHCVALAKTGGESSYTELLTCLEMSRDVRALRHAAAAPSTSTAKEPVSLPAVSMTKPAVSEKAPPLPALQEPLDKARPAVTGKDPQSTPAKEAAIADQIKKEAEQAKSEAQAAKASEANAQRKLADAEAALQRAKEETRRATAEAERSKADAKAARDAEDALKRKLSDADAARVAAEGREQACQTAAKTQTGIRARLRSWFGPKETNPKNP